MSMPAERGKRMPGGASCRSDGPLTSREVQVRLLGPVDVTVNGVSRPLAGLRRKSVLAVLALHPGEVISADKLVDAVWGDKPPARAANSLQVHISYLRQALRAPNVIEARPRGYLLNVPADAVDASQARQLIASTTPADDAGKAALLAAALRLWRGPSLVDVTEVAWLRDQGRRLDETRLGAVEGLAEARLALGEHLLLVAELEDLTTQYPFRESLHRLLILALYRCGRQADALAVYHRLRQALARELGIDPSPTLRDLEAAILHQDRGLDLPSPTVLAAQTQPARIRPAQLPQTVAAFAGRQDELAQLHTHLPPAGDGDTAGPQAATVVLVSGTAGVGKTSLAVHWAHQVKERFPDGQLYVNLRGFDPGGVVIDPAEAVRGFLDALGVPREQVPVSAQAQVSLYRTLLAGKRVLVVADNALYEQQVRPLLPGASGCLVVVTSRNQLPGLVATDGAYPLTLDLPPMAEARQMLARRLGAERISTDPDAVDDIIARCARLPLALAVAAARAVLAPSLPLAELAAQLRDAVIALDLFDSADPATNLRAVFSLSYQTLSEPAARLFRLLGACPGPDIGLPAAASLAGLPPSEVRPLLDELTRAHLLTESSARRFGFHELLRAYAIKQVSRYDNDEQRAAARRRFLDHHLYVAHAAALLLRPGRTPIDPIAPAPGVTTQQLPDRDAALTWFAAERAVLVAAVTRQPDGYDCHTWQLAWALRTFMTARGDLHDNELVQRAGLHAAQRLGDRSAQAHAHYGLAVVYIDLGALTEAEHHHSTAMRLFEQVGNPLALADIHLSRSMLAAGKGDFRYALTHAEHAHELYRSLGHLAGQAYAANNIGWFHGRLGNHRDGLPYCQEALNLLVEIGDLEAIAIACDSLGELYFGVRDPARGESYYQRAIATYRRLGNRFSEADVYSSLGDRQHRSGNREAACRAWQQALAILVDLEPDAAATARIRAQLDMIAAQPSLTEKES